MIKLGQGTWRHAEALNSTHWCSLKAITQIPNFLRYREIPLYSLASMLPLWRFTWSKKDTIGHHSSVDLQPPFGKHVSREVSFCRLGTFPCHPNMAMTIASRPLLHIEHANSLRRAPAPKIFFSEYYLSSQLDWRWGIYHVLHATSKCLLDLLLSPAFAPWFWHTLPRDALKDDVVTVVTFVFSTLCLWITIDVSTSKEPHFTQNFEGKRTLWWQLDMRIVWVLQARQSKIVFFTLADGVWSKSFGFFDALKLTTWRTAMLKEGGGAFLRHNDERRR
jgi:hypothetical protein